ncbi:uncharacterized protein LOC113334182 [Papaver somniferum]|uniref:uncharacterized protein LOC113334182 n=1 Tax=Papaver somniferum TaxID=3469 RepID=UPI000E6FF9A8|nr:uncharacterized protein LOC113334182 [Papaver somniferum]
MMIAYHLSEVNEDSRTWIRRRGDYLLIILIINGGSLGFAKVPHYPDAECDYGIIRDILQLLLLLGNPMMLRLEPVMLVVLPYLTIFLTLQDATPSGSSIQDGVAQKMDRVNNVLANLFGTSHGYIACYVGLDIRFSGFLQRCT